MAASLQDTILLDTGNPPTTEWTVKFTGVIPRRPEIFIRVERAGNGKLHLHQLLSGGNPVVFTHFEPPILVDSYADLDILKGFLGKTVYYAPNWRDPADVPSYTHEMKMVQMFPPEALDSAHQYILIKVRLEDDNTV